MFDSDNYCVGTWCWYFSCSINIKIIIKYPWARRITQVFIVSIAYSLYSHLVLQCKRSKTNSQQVRIFFANRERFFIPKGYHWIWLMRLAFNNCKLAAEIYSQAFVQYCYVNEIQWITNIIFMNDWKVREETKTKWFTFHRN